MANSVSTSSDRGAWALALTRPPLCPEIALWLLGSDVDLDRDHRSFPEGGTPYWAFCWASGQAMARHLLDHPSLVAGLRVLDVGAGSGIAAIAAAMAGAATVAACDADPAALAACRRNAGQNDVRLETFPALEPALAGGDWDVVLACDVCYEPGLRDLILAGSPAGRRILMADPGRTAQPFDGRAALARYAARTVPELDESTSGATIHALDREG